MNLISFLKGSVLNNALIFRAIKATFTASILAAAFAATAKETPLESSIKQDVMISAGDVVLGATLYRPSGIEGRIPAIVTAHGSAPTTRDGVGFYTHHALKMGFAVLSFDKRGTGQSSGTYVPFSVETSADAFADLAEDVRHCVRWLADQPGIDSTRIGLFGGSQAGWIMPLAASDEPLVTFIIIGEGVPLTAYEEYLHGDISGETIWRADKIAAADAALDAYDVPENQGFDPVPILMSLDVPTLWLFGLRDPVIPVNPSIARLEALIRAGKTNNDLFVFPFGDHNFSNVATGERYDVGAVAGDWLRKNGILSVAGTNTVP